MAVVGGSFSALGIDLADFLDCRCSEGDSRDEISGWTTTWPTEPVLYLFYGGYTCADVFNRLTSSLAKADPLLVRYCGPNGSFWQYMRNIHCYTEQEVSRYDGLRPGCLAIVNGILKEEG